MLVGAHLFVKVRSGLCYTLSMVILGVDWGERSIGLAFSRGKIAAPLRAILVKDQEQAVVGVVAICAELGVDKIVLGLPFDSRDQEGAQAQKVRRFGESLAERAGVEITYWDEALSSREATQKMIAAGRGRQARRQLDAASAAVILQSWLDSQNEISNGGG